MDRDVIPLSQVPSSTYFQVVAIHAGRGLVSQLNHMGIFVGDMIKVVHNIAGPLIIAKGNMRLALGRGMSRQIMGQTVVGPGPRGLKKK